MSEKNTCQNCVHWHKQYDENNITANQGECRRMPPSFCLVPTQQGLAKAAGYPVLHGECDPCGEFQGAPAPLTVVN